MKNASLHIMAKVGGAFGLAMLLIAGINAAVSYRADLLARYGGTTEPQYQVSNTGVTGFIRSHMEYGREVRELCRFVSEETIHRYFGQMRLMVRETIQCERLTP